VKQWVVDQSAEISVQKRRDRDKVRRKTNDILVKGGKKWGKGGGKEGGGKCGSNVTQRGDAADIWGKGEGDTGGGGYWP